MSALVQVDHLVTVDPGYSAKGRGCAVAVFRKGELSATGYLRPEHWLRPSARRFRADHLRGAEAVVWEMPQIDRRTRFSVPSALTLAAVGGQLAGLVAGENAATLVPITPSQWKGSVPKPVNHARTLRVLSPAEVRELPTDTRERVHAAQLAGAKTRWSKPGADYYGAWDGHNILDAICLGIYALGGRG